MKTIIRGSGSGIGFVLVDKKSYFFVGKAWMDYFASIYLE
jgi:hypothetical protein